MERTLAVARKPSLRYALVTPAKNEAVFIEQTLKSVIGQTVMPLKWVIVSDGSTDGTDEIVSQYAAHYEWIELLRMPERGERDFAGKVGAFNAGYARLAGLGYDIVGNLDADISVDPEYFAFLLEKFAVMPDLGVAGTPFVEEGFQYNYNFVSIDHVSGACQLFRAQCFRDIGGYKPIKGGGIDLVAVTTARMLGWRTRTFTEKTCLHHRLTGTGKDGLLKARFKVGQKDYFLGGHPLWELFRAVYQMTLRPYFLGGVFILAGYFWAWCNRYERRISPELMRFRHQEQMQQLRRFVRRALRRRGPEGEEPARLVAGGSGMNGHLHPQRRSQQ
jgi:glycosyltransferase involved in cell wall biosynthesis